MQTLKRAVKFCRPRSQKRNGVGSFWKTCVFCFFFQIDRHDKKCFTCNGCAGESVEVSSSAATVAAPPAEAPVEAAVEIQQEAKTSPPESPVQSQVAADAAEAKPSQKDDKETEIGRAHV